MGRGNPNHKNFRSSLMERGSPNHNKILEIFLGARGNPNYKNNSLANRSMRHIQVRNQIDIEENVRQVRQVNSFQRFSFTWSISQSQYNCR